MCVDPIGSVECFCLSRLDRSRKLRLPMRIRPPRIYRRVRTNRTLPPSRAIRTCPTFIDQRFVLIVINQTRCAPRLPVAAPPDNIL